MTENLTELVNLLSAIFWVGFVVFLRVTAVVALLPGFGEASVPTRIKLVLALAFTVIVAPAVADLVPELETRQLAALVLTETCVGLMLGVGVRLFILALQTAGTIAAQSTSLSQILGGASTDPIPAMGYVLVIGAICLAVTTGLHVKAAELLLISYELFPIGQFVQGAAVADWGLDQIRRAFSLAFTLAAPFIILSLLYNLVLGAINKAMPQLMVAFVGAPVITLGGLFLLFLTAPITLGVWLNALDGFMAHPTRNVP